MTDVVVFYAVTDKKAMGYKEVYPLGGCSYGEFKGTLRKKVEITNKKLRSEKVVDIFKQRFSSHYSSVDYLALLFPETKDYVLVGRFFDLSFHEYCLYKTNEDAKKMLLEEAEKRKKETEEEEEDEE